MTYFESVYIYMVDLVFSMAYSMAMMAAMSSAILFVTLICWVVIRE